MEFFTSMFDNNYEESNLVEIMELPVMKIVKLPVLEIMELSVMKIVKLPMNWAQKIGRENGVVVVTERTKNNAAGDVIKIFLMCDRGGVYKSTAKVRRSGTRKTNCLFQLVGKYHNEYNGWALRVSHGDHNHELAQHMEGHPYAMRLTEDQKTTVRNMYRNKSAPRDILSFIQGEDETNASSLRTVHNETYKVRKEIFQGESHMEVLFRLLGDKGYTHDFRKNSSTNAMEDLFFMHPTSYVMFCAFPHVLIIDTTYNTNEYKLPLVQIVGVTSTGKTITIALSFISKETEDNFTWVLTRLKSMLHKCMMPRVILIDRDLALMNACNVVFPDAAKLLCRWHISQNVKKHCKQSFVRGNKNWEYFEELWSSLIHSPTLDAYEYNYKRLHDGFTGKHKRVFDYVNTTWLVKYKEMFVSAWTNQVLHFGNSTTNRVESAHALLKKHLLTAKSTLEKFVGVIDQIVKLQQKTIKGTFEDSRNKKMNDHGIPLFKELRESLSMGMGADVIFALVVHCHVHEDINCESAVEAFKQEFEKQSDGGKRNMLSRFWSFIKPASSNLQVPIVQKNTRGRPKSKDIKKKSKHEAPLKHSNSTTLTLRDEDDDFLSSQLEPSRQSLFVGSQQGIRQSSYVGSQQGRQNSHVLGHYYHRYLDQVHPIVRPFVTHIQDVAPDGNCGYRSMAVALGYNEDKWKWVQSELLAELKHNEAQYKNFFGDDTFSKVLHGLYWFESGFAPKQHWIMMSSIRCTDISIRLLQSNQEKYEQNPISKQTCGLMKITKKVGRQTRFIAVREPQPEPELEHSAPRHHVIRPVPPIPVHVDDTLRELVVTTRRIDARVAWMMDWMITQVREEGRTVPAQSGILGSPPPEAHEAPPQ
ncbi:uncharacterized protein LOC143605728 [Bidens hawaiensis]|uniref:uncharacterized protein LOC143605728 n=1 Tax=Bidens hawaiensis TaxID=980011 RepID=UPI004049B084